MLCAVDGGPVCLGDESASSWAYPAQDVWRRLTVLVHSASDSWSTCESCLHRPTMSSDAPGHAGACTVYALSHLPLHETKAIPNPTAQRSWNWL